MIKLIAQALKNWIADDPFSQSAAAAYYAIFSLPGLLIIIMALAALFFDQAHVQDAVIGNLRTMLGADAASSINNIVMETQHENRDIWAFIAGLATLAFGATGLFSQLQKSLNRIFEVEVKKSTGWIKFIKNRAISFGLILIIGFLLLISLSVTTVISLFSDWVSNLLSIDWTILLIFINLCVSFIIITALFTLIFKILPDAYVSWRSALAGGMLSTVFFNGGEYALQYYFELAKPASSFGAAGSIILVMLWVSYSCMILFIGAEFAKIYAENHQGHKVKPDEIAKKKLRNL